MAAASNPKPSIESLKTLRFLHQILMLATAAILILAMTPDPSSSYEAALNELNAIRRSGYPTGKKYYVYLGVHTHASEPGLGEFLLSAVREAGIRVSRNVEIPEVYATDVARGDGRLADYDAFLTHVHEVAPVVLGSNGYPPKASLVRFLRTQVAIQARQNPTVVFQGVQFTFSGAGEISNGIDVVFLRDFHAGYQWEGALQFNFAIPDSISDPSFNVSLPATYSMGRIQKGHFALDWLQSTKFGDQLVDPKSGIVLPKLKSLSFWEKLRLMRVDNAIPSLQDRLDSLNTESISFFGISVSKNLALWAGPTLLFFLEWIFFLHLRSFGALFGNGDEAAKEYPWVALFPGWACGLTLYLSIFALPLAASAVLLWRFGQLSQLSAQTGIAFTISTLALDVFVFGELRRLRRQTAATPPAKA